MIGFGSAIALVAAGTIAMAPPPTPSAGGEHVTPKVASATAVASEPTPSLRRMLGQRIMIGIPGTHITESLRRSIRRGDVGSVILFSRNIRSVRQVRELTRSLQAAALAGGNPPLLIAVDQEGGAVKRFVGAPPRWTPAQLVGTRQPARALEAGRETGRFLKSVGVNWNLAPVVDVPTSRQAFILKQGRSFSDNASTVTRFAGAFARGLQRSGVAADAKHFPGVGSLHIDTDFRLSRVVRSVSAEQQALLPYRTLIADGLDTVMLATAVFPEYDAKRPAALSPNVIDGLLRRQLGFTGVTITDSLNCPTGYSPQRAGVLAARAGADVLLYTDGAPGVLNDLLSAASLGTLTESSVTQSYERLIRLKREVG